MKCLDFLLTYVNENWSLIIIFCVKSERKYNIHSFWDLRRYLIPKSEYFDRQGFKFSHICEMNIASLSDLRNMT